MFTMQLCKLLCFCLLLMQLVDSIQPVEEQADAPAQPASQRRDKPRSWNKIVGLLKGIGIFGGVFFVIWLIGDTIGGFPVIVFGGEQSGATFKQLIVVVQELT
jgi:hypothetical protein